MVVDGDALLEGPVFRGCDNVEEFLLPHEEDIQQLSIGILDVGEQPDFLQQGLVQTLGLVDDKQGIASGGAGLAQELFEVEQKINLVRVASAHAVGGRDKVEKRHGGQARILDGGHDNILVELAEQGADEGGLAGAHAPGKQQKSLAVAHAVDQYRQGLPVLAPQPQEGRVGADLERLLRQSVEVAVHG